LDYDSPLYASHSSWDNRHMPPHPAIDWNGILQTFCLGWPWTNTFPISSFQVAKITDLSHYT
jgi:hypothetical protein